MPTQQIRFFFPSLLLALVACREASVSSGQHTSTTTDAGDSMTPSQAPSEGDSRSGSDSGGAVDAASDDGPICAEQVQPATRVPVDLLFLIDVSSSMKDMVANGQTKYELIGDALTGFFDDRQSAGLGVALQFFPLPLDTACSSDADCGPVNTSFGLPERFGGCRVPTICAPPNAPLGIASQICSPKSSPSDCHAPSSCMPVGYCSVSGWQCTAINQACATGQAGDVCIQKPVVCNGSSICNPTLFHRLDVPFADLPAAAGGLAGALGARVVEGSTPMGPAVQGALASLAERSSQRPDRPAALVLVTDGLPNACGAADDVTTIASTIGRAAAAATPLKTYVIGVVGDGDPQAAMEKTAFAQLAKAGGTTIPIVVTPTAGLSDALLLALKGIRDRALPCQFAISPSNGTRIDYGRVNVSIRGASGTSSVLYAASADRCDPKTGGWYYDVDPTSGAVPQRIIACPATCDRFKSDPDAAVDLRFGCKTVVIP